MDHDEPRSPPLRMLRLDPAVETYRSSDGNRCTDRGYGPRNAEVDGAVVSFLGQETLTSGWTSTCTGYCSTPTPAGQQAG